MNNQYIPDPYITSTNNFSSDIQTLIEIMAKNVHDEWAAGRIREGWTNGKERDDRLKKHPALIPYEKLPESEKDFDRRTVIAAVSILFKKGYTILPASYHQNT